MSKLAWATEADKVYESGVSRGVLYPEEGPGVPWNGLVSVQEAFVGGETSSYHIDGFKYLDMMGAKNFQATIRAYSAPDEFENCLGEISPRPGFILTDQQKSRFGFSYQTLVGDFYSYKIHLVYNLMAARTKRNAVSMSRTGSAEILEWRVNSVPVEGSNFKPSAHFILDANKTPIGVLEAVEDILYGTESEEARLPEPSELIELF